MPRVIALLRKYDNNPDVSVEIKARLRTLFLLAEQKADFIKIILDEKHRSESVHSNLDSIPVTSVIGYQTLIYGLSEDDLIEDIGQIIESARMTYGGVTEGVVDWIDSQLVSQVNLFFASPLDIEHDLRFVAVMGPSVVRFDICFYCIQERISGVCDKILIVHFSTSRVNLLKFDCDDFTRFIKLVYGADSNFIGEELRKAQEIYQRIQTALE
ncbi:hypothetical protein [Chitinibacter tainanensis]|uniref:hypothetical protein n=1 Tax=Chitinibacter tainanensis TaxID=230667 RepID=UPI00048D1476|nr:hypothetical protein [Chitinibacter tainanensis]